MSAVQHGIIQRFEHVGEQRHNVQKVVKEHVVHRKAGERIQTRAHHAPALVFYPAAHPQVSPAARHSKFKAEHWHHGPGRPPIGQQQGEPEKRAAAQVRCPAETAPLLNKIVGIGIKGNLLVVKVPGVVEKVAVQAINDAVGQKQRRRHRKAKPEHLPIP